MDQISEHINSLNYKIHSHDQMGEMIVNLSNNKCKTTTNPQAISIRFINRYQRVLFTPLKRMYQMLIGKQIREKYVHPK